MDIDAAYSEFVSQVINLCEEKDDYYNAIALTYVELELQFQKGFRLCKESFGLCTENSQTHY